MSYLTGFYMDIQKIHIAHEFILDQVRKCEYPNGRGSYGLVFALNGRAEYRFCSGQRVAVKKGDLLFISPSAAYSIATEQEFQHYTVNFDIQKETSSANLLDMQYHLLREKHTETFERLFRKLVALWSGKTEGYRMLAISVLYELLCLFCLQCMEQKNGRPDHRLQPAKQYIEQHFDRPICLEQLAYLSNMSVTNFRREWKRHYEETPIQYRDSIRLSYAKEYLNTGYYTVSEIANKCGFDDTSYFIRFFKKRVGSTPLRYSRNL